MFSVSISLEGAHYQGGISVSVLLLKMVHKNDPCISGSDEGGALTAGGHPERLFRIQWRHGQRCRFHNVVLSGEELHSFFSYLLDDNGDTQLS